ncbi:hypothetical protein D3C81_1210820 [compost metagenome]
MGHVDHTEQAEGDRQTQCREQQNRAQGHTAECLAEHLADQQFAFDLSEAGFGRSAYGDIGFNARLEQAFETGAGQRVTGFTEQADGCEAHGRVAVDQLQVGQGETQGTVDAFVLFARQLLVEEFQLRRFGTFL